MSDEKLSCSLLVVYWSVSLFCDANAETKRKCRLLNQVGGTSRSSNNRDTWQALLNQMGGKWRKLMMMVRGLSTSFSSATTNSTSTILQSTEQQSSMSESNEALFSVEQFLDFVALMQRRRGKPFSKPIHFFTISSTNSFHHHQQAKSSTYMQLLWKSLVGCAYVHTSAPYSAWVLT